MTARWEATITYRTGRGDVTVPHLIEELEELADLVERGPDWDTIVDVRIVKARNVRPAYTVEQAERE